MSKQKINMNLVCLEKIVDEHTKTLVILSKAVENLTLAVGDCNKMLSEMINQGGDEQ